ncbi:MAG: phosphotransferase [Pseudomonadales bacterium]|nr:phosphotransferase [Pseudomonadales bacterium]
MLLSPHAPKEMYENEVNFYRYLRPELHIESPRAYASEFDVDSGQFGIIMDDLNVRGATFPNATTPVSVTQMQGLLTTLARLHATFWNSERFRQDLDWLPTPYKGGMSDIFRNYGLDIIKDQVAKNVFKQELIAPLKMTLDQMWPALWKVQGVFTEKPQTVLHGDTHIANTYLLPDNTGGLLDWQLMIRSVWSQDVAYVICTGLTTEQRREHENSLLRFYLEALAEQGLVEVPDRDEAFELYRRSVIWGLVIGWLITPPSNYGEEITSTNISKLVNAVIDLESFEAL